MWQRAGATSGHRRRKKQQTRRRCSSGSSGSAVAPGGSGCRPSRSRAWNTTSTLPRTPGWKRKCRDGAKCTIASVDSAAGGLASGGCTGPARAGGAPCDSDARELGEGAAARWVEPAVQEAGPGAVSGEPAAYQRRRRGTRRDRGGPAVYPRLRSVFSSGPCAVSPWSPWSPTASSRFERSAPRAASSLDAASWLSNAEATMQASEAISGDVACVVGIVNRRRWPQ